MDTITLVENQIADGRKLINLLSQKHIDVTAAAWIRTGEESAWLLYIATDVVDEKGLLAAYREVCGVLRSMTDAWISTSEIKLIGRTNAITKDILSIRGQRTGNIPTRFHGSAIGGIGIEDVYIYSLFIPSRLSFMVTYVKQGDGENWLAMINQGELIRDAKAKGVVAYATVGRVGETESDAKHVSISVLLEIDPRIDDERVLNDPSIRQVLVNQAQTMADEELRCHHPDAEIEYIDDSSL